jgi:trehalose 6-phosphate synthase
VPEYEAMQRAVAEQAGRVNGALGTVDWVPIRYINRSLRRPALAGLYRMAKLALVTPLRDGMNLVAKEFVAAQNEEDPGVLLLSRFAGAAQELKEAVLVNPYDVEGTAAAIAQSLIMPVEERRERWKAMMKTLHANNVFTWCDTFLDDLTALSVPRKARAPSVSSSTSSDETSGRIHRKVASVSSSSHISRC